MARAGQLESIIEPVISGLGYELWGLEHHAAGSHSVLRIYIDAEQGIDVDDCARVSHQLSGVLEVEGSLKGAYTLEVSSPGLDRLLFKPEHFERYAGHQAKLNLSMAVEQKRKIVGTLVGVKQDMLLIEADEHEYSVPLDWINKARLVPEL